MSSPARFRVRRLLPERHRGFTPTLLSVPPPIRVLLSVLLLSIALFSAAGCAERPKPVLSVGTMPPDLAAVEWTDKARRLWINGAYTDPVTANSHLTRALELSPDDPAILHARAVALLQLDDRKRAMADLDHAVRVDPEMVAARTLRGRLNMQNRRYEAAAEDYGAVVAADPNNTSAYGERGVAEGFMGRYKQALDDLDSALALDPSRDDLYFQRATTQVHLDDREAAVHDLTEAISIQPRNALYYSRRGRLHLYALNLDAARRDFTAALDLAPANAEAHLGMAQILACSPKERDRDAALALEHATAAVQHAAPVTAEYLDALAAAQAENGDFATAVATEEKALAMAAEREADILPILEAHHRLYLDGKPLRF